MSEEAMKRKPIIAILTMDDEKEYFRGNRVNFAETIAAGKEMGYTVYILTIKDLKLSQKRVVGYNYMQETNVWQQEWFPLPHVIYNRIPLREDEMQPAVRRKIQDVLSHSSIKIFNPYYFNKWHLFEWLKKSPSTKKYIPKTQRLRTSSGLGKMLKKHAYLYLKPEAGKAGVGIMTLRMNPAKSLKYRLKVQDKKGSISYKAAKIQKLWTRIRKEAGVNSYIVQQGITLATMNKRPFDLRLLAQKNGKGQWDVTGIGARVAGISSITTHVPRGGSIEDPEKILTTIFGTEQARSIMAKARAAAVVIAKQVERGSGHTLGEMSMDLGVDTTGGIWFFEANAKPMKFDEPHIRRRSLERIFQYCSYLSRMSG